MTNEEVMRKVHTEIVVLIVFNKGATTKDLVRLDTMIRNALESDCEGEKQDEHLSKL